MSQNLSVLDQKPGNLRVSDSKPQNIQVLDTKPQNKLRSFQETEQLYEITIQAGQSMGLLLALTYPTTFTVISNKST